MSDPFAPPGTAWTRVSPRLLRVRRVSLLLTAGVLTALAAAAGTWLVGGPGPAVAAVLCGVAALALGWVLVERNWRSWGYCERDEDLLITHGVMFRSLSVVPYGRIQYADVTAGPLERRFGVATVRVHTAAAATQAAIPGLEPAEAARLRDRLAALGAARTAGL